MASSDASRKPTAIRVISHRVDNKYYVVYTVQKSNDTTFEATEFEMQNHMDILDEYRENLTGQYYRDGKFEVKRILAHRSVHRCGKVDKLYLIEWKGYPHPVWFSEMWESELLQCKDLLAQYTGAAATVRKIIGHRYHNKHYVAFRVAKSDGSTFEASQSELEEHMEILADYRKKLTGQCAGPGEYEVKKVLAHRMVVLHARLDPLYLVEWKGFPHPVWHTEMWEEDLLENSRNLLDEYAEEPFEARS